MKYLILLTALAVGCSPAAPSPDEIQPFIAVVGTYSVLASSTTPAPPPQVQGDVCPACYGRGIVGDQTNMVTCQACKGTGKVVKHPPVVVTQDCRSGTCPKPKSIAR